MDLHELISKLGFPIASAVAGGGALWAVMRWVMGNLHNEIADLHKKIDDQRDMAVRLIDRIRSLEDSITRVEIVTRTAYELSQDWGRIGRSSND